MTIFYVIFFLYTVAISWGTIKLEHLRYRLLFGYVAGIAFGTMSLIFATFDIAIIISIFTGVIANARMMCSPNR